MMKNMGYGRERLKDIIKKEAEEEQQQEEEDVDLTPNKHGKKLKGAYRSFAIPGTSNTDIDSYFDQTRPHIRTLIKNQLKKIGSAKIIMTLRVIWKKPIMPFIELDPEDAKNAQDLVDGIAGDNYIRMEMPYNSLMTEFFQGSDNNDLIQRLLAYIRTQVENPRMPQSGFSLDKIMQLYINFHRLVLTRGSSYIELPEWIQNKKVVINPQNKDEECFKWTVIGALHHEDIKKDHQRISRLRYRR